MLALSSRAITNRLATICLLRSELNITTMLLQARLASGSAASCSSRAAMTMSPSLSPPLQQRLVPPLRSTPSRPSFAAASLPSPTFSASPMLLSRTLSSSSTGYKKSPGVRTRLAAGAAARGKTDVDSTNSSADAVSQPAALQPAAAAAPRRTVEQIVKRITRGATRLFHCSSSCCVCFLYLHRTCLFRIIKK